MKISISVSSSHMVDDPRVGARHMIERARAANEAGLDTLFIGDHHATPFPYYQNIPMLGRMLAEWNDKPYGALFLLPLLHPVTLAEQIGTLAAISPGRFIMQCGLGDHRQGDAMGIDMKQRVGLFEAHLDVMRALWAGEAVTETKYWNLKDATISPRPAEPVEIWIGGVVPAAIRRTARMADGWLGAPSLTYDQAAESISMYRQACEEFDREPTAHALRRDIYIGDTAESAKSVVDGIIDSGYRGIDPDALMYGSAEQVAEEMLTYGDLGFSDISIRNMSTNQDEALETISRLADVKKMLG